MVAPVVHQRFRPRGRVSLSTAVALSLLTCARWPLASEPENSPAARRAIDFLVREVPDWPSQHRCFSCHNNGDGARALLIARQRGWDVPDAALVETTQWLKTPERWQRNGGNSDYNDQRLIAVQFTSALATLVDVNGPDAAAAAAALRTAAETLAELQFPDGSWAFEVEGQIGSPIGYGRPLMTVVARNTLANADAEQFALHVSRADNWLRRAEPRTVLDAAAVLWGIAEMDNSAQQHRLDPLLEIIRRGQSRRGGWGPYAISPPEPFDTAVVLLALSRLEPSDETGQWIADGRRFLEANQLPSGAWPATIRPPGIESYPQKLSTTAWAALALIWTE